MVSSRTKQELLRFVHYFCTVTEVRPVSTNASYAVFLKRTKNRLVLNEAALLSMVRRHRGLETIVLDLNTESMAHVVRVLRGANMLIAMHGSALVLSMFLRPNSTVLELFPFAVNPDHYTPYKTLAQLRGIFYLSWRNLNKSNTITHPNREPHLGGIAHLSPEQQQNILQSNEVPRHLCCTHPEWLFRIYQDTVVDDSVGPILEKVPDARHYPNQLYQPLLPGYAINVQCTLDRHQRLLLVDWLPPWNIQYILDGNCHYEVWLQTGSAATTLESPCCRYSGHTNETVFKVWVRAVCQENTGPFNIFPAQCSLD